MLKGQKSGFISPGALKGNVYFLDSGHTPAVGVHIRDKDKMTNGDYTKIGGEFTLVFPQTPSGKYINRVLGKKDKKRIDARNSELEWVNESDFTYLSLVQNAKPLKVIVCPKGARDLAAQKYYKIIKNLQSEPTKTGLCIMP